MLRVRIKEDRVPHEARGAGTVVRPKITAVRVLVAGAAGVLLYVGHAAFIPVALALLAALVLSGPVELMHRLGLPRSLGALLVMLLLIGAAAGLLDFLSEPAQHWFEEAPHTVRVIAKKIRPLAQVIAKVDDLRNSADNIGLAGHAAPAAAPASGALPPSAPALLLDVTRGVVLSTTTVLILTLFLLAGGPPMLARMTSALVSDLQLAHIIGVIEKVRREVGRFYVTTTLINVGLGLASGCVMMWCGMPNPFLWGTVAAALNFVPYAGPAAALILLTSVAFVSFDGFAQVVVVAGSFLALIAIEGQVIQPLLVGRRLKLNPMLVFLALWFGGLFWGIAGVVLATPTLAALKVIAENSARGGPLVDFLSPQSSAPPLALAVVDEELEPRTQLAMVDDELGPHTQLAMVDDELAPRAQVAAADDKPEPLARTVTVS
jgi:predicted PurR-regulated permease PerM